MIKHVINSVINSISIVSLIKTSVVFHNQKSADIICLSHYSANMMPQSGSQEPNELMITNKTQYKMFLCWTGFRHIGNHLTERNGDRQDWIFSAAGKDPDGLLIAASIPVLSLTQPALWTIPLLGRASIFFLHYSRKWEGRILKYVTSHRVRMMWYGPNSRESKLRQADDGRAIRTACQAFQYLPNWSCNVKLLDRLCNCTQSPLQLCQSSLEVRPSFYFLRNQYCSCNTGKRFRSSRMNHRLSFLGSCLREGALAQW